MLKSGRGVGEAKWHNEELIRAVSTSKSGFPFMSSSYT
jgi:hypothetical protein